jgi:single-strand DNA-binding protein
MAVTRTTRTTRSRAPAAHRHRNEVRLVGRLAAPPVTATLPSGDVVVSWRVVVDRDPRSRRPPTVDTVDCAAWSRTLQRRVAAWQPGDVVAVDGVLRRRFWRGPSGAVSRYEVEASSVNRLSRAG